MKTEKDIKQKFAQRYLWKKNADKLMIFIIPLLMVVITIWQFDMISMPIMHLIMYYLTATGFGYCISITIAWFRENPDMVKKELKKMEKKISSYRSEIESLSRGIGDDVKNLTLDELQKLNRIRELKEKIVKLEIEYIILDV